MRGASTRFPQAVHHQAYPEQSDRGSDHIGSVGTIAIEPPVPEQGQYDEEAAVSGIDQPEVADLQGGDGPVDHQDHGSEESRPAGATIPQPPPHQSAAADLTMTGDEKEQDPAE